EAACRQACADARAGAEGRLFGPGRGAVAAQARDPRVVDGRIGRPGRPDRALRRAPAGVAAGPRLQLGRAADGTHPARPADGFAFESAAVAGLRPGVLPGPRQLPARTPA